MSQNESRAAAIAFGINVFVYEEDVQLPHWKHYNTNINWLKKTSLLNISKENPSITLARKGNHFDVVTTINVA